MKHKFLIMAGGTGGHVFPALAVARELVARGHEVEWLGTARGIESRLIPDAGITLNIIPIEGVRGKGLWGLIKAPFLILKAVMLSRNVIREKQIDAVIGFGGFASGPGALAAKTLNKPVITHEQNAIAGTTNKLASRFASRILMAFAGAYKNSKTTSVAEVVGNPVREEIVNLPTPSERIGTHTAKTLNVLILGGSLGALAINRILPQAIALVGSEYSVSVVHQTGKDHLEFTQKLYQQYNVEADVQPFIADIASAYQQCDLVICRAGALTVSELMAAGIAAILIPLPNAIDDHQTANAKILQAAGAGILLPQSDLEAQHLADMIQQQFFINSAEVNQPRLIAMGDAARSLSIPRSAQLVADACEEATRGECQGKV